ncbi:hypothetical protein GOB34_21160 [Sinorhizobium meliloti]|nr:hypothetical protein [Sinorhizobium meliloti]
MTKGEADGRTRMMTEALQFMDVWFWATGTTMQGFVDDVERLQPGNDDPSDFAGIHAELAARVFESGINTTWALHIIRAMQHLAITRPWRPEHKPAQFALFD